MTKLKLSTDSDAYVNARTYYAENCSNPVLPYLGYQAQVVMPFYRWLATQDATVSHHFRDPLQQYGVDSYDVAVGTDVLEFSTEHSMLMFLLRWS